MKRALHEYRRSARPATVRSCREGIHTRTQLVATLPVTPATPRQGTMSAAHRQTVYRAVVSSLHPPSLMA